MITDSTFFIGVIIMSLVLTLYSSFKKDLLLSMGASGMWMVLLFWLFFSTTPLLDIEENWVEIFMWVIGILVFVPLLAQIDFSAQQEEENQADLYMRHFRSRVRGSARRASITRKRRKSLTKKGLN